MKVTYVRLEYDIFRLYLGQSSIALCYNGLGLCFLVFDNMTETEKGYLTDGSI